MSEAKNNKRSNLYFCEHIFEFIIIIYNYYCHYIF